MINKEAIEVFENPSKHIKLINGQICYSQFFVKAMEMAIKALEQEPCEDAVSRQAVLDKMKERDEELSSICPRDIRELPSVTPQPKTGHWIVGKYTEDDIRYNDRSYKCSECGRVVDFKDNFCPNCGAKMVDPQESEETE